MTTFANLQTRVSRILRDPGLATFSAQETADFLNEALVEVSRLAPKRFVEMVPLSSDALSYVLAAGSSPEVEVKRVEVWDVSVTPNKQVGRLQPLSGEYEDNSQVGWEYFAGALHIPNSAEANLIVGTHQLRVWGYAPWSETDTASGSGTDTGMSNELEKAVLVHCQVAGLQRLIFERDLFSQWQGDANNTDVSAASLLSGLAQAQDQWRRLSKAITVLR